MHVGHCLLIKVFTVIIRKQRIPGYFTPHQPKVPRIESDRWDAVFRCGKVISHVMLQFPVQSFHVEVTAAAGCVNPENFIILQHLLLIFSKHRHISHVHNIRTLSSASLNTDGFDEQK